MILLKIIINLTIGYFLLKILTLLWSVISYKILYKKDFKVRTRGFLNDDNYKGKVLLCVLLDHQAKYVSQIVEQYQDILLGYKNVHVAFITNEQEDIEIAMKHNDEQSTREVINDLINPINEKLERRDAVMLIHYPYDNDNKAQMIDFAVKEFMLKYQTIEKIYSYVGVFDGSSVLEQAFAARLEKTFTKYDYPELIETINIRMKHMHRLRGPKDYLAYLLNADRTIKAINRCVCRTNIKNIIGINKLLPYYSDFNGTLIRLDMFYEEDMLSGTSQVMDTIIANYYFKKSNRQTMFAENDLAVISNSKDLEKELEKDYILWHNMKKQAGIISKYRLVNPIKKFMFKSYYNLKMIYNSSMPYVIFFSLVCLLIAKKISMMNLIVFFGIIYLYSLLFIITYHSKSKWYDNDHHLKSKFFMRVCAFIMYPLYLVYRCNGFYDYVVRDMVFKKQKDINEAKKPKKKKKEIVVEDEDDLYNEELSEQFNDISKL